MDSLLKKRYAADVDMSHGFLSTKGNPSARLMAARIAVNHESVSVFDDLRKETVPLSMKMGFERHHAVSLALREIDLNDWHAFSDLNEKEPEEYEGFLSVDDPPDGPDPDDLETDKEG